jgi:protein-disulfide isomerase
MHAQIRVPAGATHDGAGIAIGDGPLVVEAYIDFLCPFCRQFEQTTGPTLDRLVADSAITLVYHPLAFLDRLSTTRYSSRAASASGCASDAGRFPPYLKALFGHQPPEGGAGLSDEELVGLGRSVGISEEGFSDCVLGHAHLPWVAHVTERAIERGVEGTPTVFVEGTQVAADPRSIVAALAAVVR